MTPTKHPKRRLLRHYVEMVVVMFAGMVVLGAPAGWLFSALGTSWSRLSPALMLFAMAVTMTVPMVAWMRYRGHAWAEPEYSSRRSSITTSMPASIATCSKTISVPVPPATPTQTRAMATKAGTNIDAAISPVGRHACPR